MKKHFVEFYSPGTFFSESTEKPIDSWDVEEAKDIAKSISERYGAVPYGFRFITRERGEEDLDSRVTDKSSMFFLGGEVLSLDDVKSRNDPNDRILISNMEGNGYKYVIENRNSYLATLPFDEDKDVVLDWFMLVY